MQTLLDGGTVDQTLTDVYEELATAFKTLEVAHEALCLVLEEDDPEAEGSYLDGPSDLLSEMQLKVNKAIGEKNSQKKMSEAENEKKKLYDSSLAALKSNVESFGKPSLNLSKLSEEKVASYADMRLELAKVEAAVVKLQEEKVKVLNLDPTADLSSFIDMFNNLVVEETNRCKRIVLEYVKDEASADSTTVTGGATGASRVSFSTTKRETVMLPQFSGDEKTAFLKYPVWKQQ